MSSTDSVNINKLSEFVSFLEKLPKGFILSRGHSKDFSLLPGAFRKDSSGNRLYSKAEIQKFIEHFEINSYPYLKNANDIKEDKELMVYAQHFGLPTKLLDFTYSHIISLMFCLENAFDDNESDDGVVWFLNPYALNGKSTNGESKKIFIIPKDSKLLDQISGPVVVTCRRIHERIRTQDGLFVYFQEENYSKCLEEYADDSILRKVIINREAKKGILRSLNSLGVGYHSLYPELSSVAKDIILKQHIEEYIRSLEEDNDNEVWKH